MAPVDQVILTQSLQSPLGELIVGATERGLCLVEFADRSCLAAQITTLEKRLRCHARLGLNRHLEQIDSELMHFFGGQLEQFHTPLDVVGTPFEKAVWECLLSIPYGKTATYSSIAQQVGRPGAQRAVGRANGTNKLAIVIPCHRVVDATGNLGGYGGGLWRKQFLLALEAAKLKPSTLEWP